MNKNANSLNNRGSCPSSGHCRNTYAKAPMSQLDLGVIAHTSKENERRLPLHPRHLERLTKTVRPHVFLEEG